MAGIEDKVVGFLIEEWQEGLRITTIPQALRALGLPDDEETRWRIGQRLERAWQRRLGLRGVWRGLRWVRGVDRPRIGRLLPALGRLPSLAAEARAWNPVVYILSNDEKLIARYILRAGRVPAAEEMSTVLGIDPATVETGLRMLVRVGFLVKANREYRLAPGYQNLVGGLGFNFHTVTLQGGEQFNVP